MPNLSSPYKLNTPSTFVIVIISLIALLIGHLMINTFVPNTVLNFIGLIVTSLFIYFFTLRKKDYFSFVMVIYFCSTFPYLLAKGGAFNIVSFLCISLFILFNYRLPFERRIKDKWLRLFVSVWFLSSVLGWIFNYTGSGLEYIYSISTFCGVILILLIASKLELNSERIKVFIRLNFVLIIYSTIASINKYINLLDLKSPMMPSYGEIEEYFEGGGLIGSSPLYGEHSLILLILFSVFYILGNKHMPSKKTLIIAIIISYINIFMSISRSVFLLSLLGLFMIYFFQFRLLSVQRTKIIQPLIIISVITATVFGIVKSTRLDYVFGRIQDIQERNIEAGGLNINRIMDGSAFNREEAFSIAEERYKSKTNWLIGYGWGLDKNNRDAFYIDPTILRGSAHSQIFATLFLFGWIGFLAYWGLIFGIIIRSYKLLAIHRIDNIIRISAYFFMIAFILFTLNEIKADSISIPSYFAVTCIWMGLAYSALSYYGSSIKQNSAINQYHYEKNIS